MRLSSAIQERKSRESAALTDLGGRIGDLGVRGPEAGETVEAWDAAIERLASGLAGRIGFAAQLTSLPVALGLTVIAEGVETDEIMGRLRSFGCDEAQGYFIAKPMPADQFLAWVRARAQG